jgi:serine/threonine protein kinase
MHCDVKPSNILLGRDGAVKMCDFGIASKLMESKCHTLAVVGSKSYLAVTLFFLI